MANCIRCGRELPRFSWGDATNVCRECRSSLQTVPANVPAVATARAIPLSAKWPPVTTTLVAINVLVFLAMLARGISITEPTTGQLLQWGADFGPLSLGSQPWRILTSNYLHIGILHIFFNMWCLLDLGRLAERVFGRVTFFLIYTASGIAGSLASLWWHPMVIGAGASGAIFGLAGALIAALYLGHLPIPKVAIQRTLKSLLLFAGYNLFFGAAISRIDNSAHIGGLIGGLLLGAALAKHLMVPAEERNLWRNVLFSATALVLVGCTISVRAHSGYVIPLNRAMDDMRHNRSTAAVNELEPVARKQPNNKLVSGVLAEAYIRAENYSQAEATLKHVLTLAPDDTAARTDLGWVYLKTNRFAQAYDIFTRLVAENPKDSDSQEMLGNALEGLHRETDAIVAYQKALSLNSDNNDARISLGTTLLRTGQLDSAITTLEDAAERDPKSADAQRALAAAYQKQGNNAGALAALQRAAELEQKNSPQPTK